MFKLIFITLSLWSSPTQARVQIQTNEGAILTVQSVQPSSGLEFGAGVLLGSDLPLARLTVIHRGKPIEIVLVDERSTSELFGFKVDLKRGGDRKKELEKLFALEDAEMVTLITPLPAGEKLSIDRISIKTQGNRIERLIEVLDQRIAENLLEDIRNKQASAVKELAEYSRRGIDNPPLRRQVDGLEKLAHGLSKPSLGLDPKALDADRKL